MNAKQKQRRALISTSLGRLLRVAIGVVVGGASLLYLFLFLMQDRMIFIRQPLASGADERAHDTEPLELNTPDGITLRGWLVPGEGEGPRPLLVYFGGNAEEVSYTIDEARAYARAGWSVALVNYRGYGESGGKPSETALTKDAELIYDTLTKRPDINASRVAVMGRSLGTGVAVYLASVRKVIGAALVSPYDSFVAVAKEHYPHVPAGILLKHKFDSVSKAPAIKAPLLVIMGTADTIIPPARSEALIAKWGGPVQSVIVPGADHNNLSLTPGYSRSIASFLLELP